MAGPTQEKLATLPVQEYNLRSQNSSIRHIGPVAQDFYARRAPAQCCVHHALLPVVHVKHHSDPQADVLIVVAEAPGSEVVVETLTNGSPRDAWHQITFDMGSCAGQLT